MMAVGAVLLYNKYYKTEGEAATEIQSTWRGRRARKNMLLQGQKSSGKKGGIGSLQASLVE